MAKLKKAFGKDATIRSLLWVLVCCFVYLVFCSLLTANWRHPSNLTYSEWELHKEMDVVGKTAFMPIL